MQIDSNFDSGNIVVEAIDGTRARLSIRKDHQSDFYQWFHFRVTAPAGTEVELAIVNLAASAYPEGWEGYSARVSSDRENWLCADTSHDRNADGGTLTIRTQVETGVLWVAYFEPYSWERHQALVADASAAPGVTHRTLGHSIEARPIDALTMGTGPKQVWIYARQHPGESMVEWWMEGALAWLTDPANPQARQLRQRATLHLVPNMNPDGSVRGHLRTNAIGVNLNREWDTPSLERSPEVLCVRDAMDATGVDIAIDVHGDESIPAVFFAGFEGIPSWSDAQGERYYRYRDTLAQRTPDFQVVKGYDVSGPGAANLSMSTNQVAERFGAMAVTLEMPFKDNDDLPDAERGWSSERSMRLAEVMLATLAEMIDEL